MQAGSGYFELADYVGVLRRRWPVAVALTLAGVALAGAYCLVAVKTYTATVLVQVNALPTNANALGGRTGGPVNMDNEAQIVQSAQVAALVQAQLKTALAVPELIKDIHVVVPPNTTFLQISCDSPSPGGAQACANAAGRAYLLNRRVAALTIISAGVRALDAQAASLQAAISTLKARLATRGHPGGAPTRVAEQLKLTADLSRLAAVQAHVDSVTPLRASLAVRSGTVVGVVVTPASRPTAPTSPRALLVLPSGLIAGLIIGLAVAFIKDRRDPRVHSARDTERLADLPTIFCLPADRQWPLTALAAPWSGQGHAFAELARHVATTLGPGNHVLLVAGTSPGSGSNVVAANLACSLARTRGETLVMCRGLRGDAASRLLGAVDGRGLADLLAGTAALSDVARRRFDLPRLRVITCGFDTASAAYDMQYDKVKQLIDELRAEARYVIIEVQSVGEDAAAFVMAEFASAAIVVVDAGASRAADVVDCVARLNRLPVTILGTAILPATRATRPRGSAGFASAPGPHDADDAWPVQSDQRRDAGAVR